MHILHERPPWETNPWKAISYHLLSTHLKNAHALGQARLSKDSKEIERGELEHEAYRRACLKADEINLGVKFGNLS